MGDAAFAVVAASIFSGTANAAFGKFLAKASMLVMPAERKSLEAKYGDNGFYADGKGNLSPSLNPDSLWSSSCKNKSKALNRDAAEKQV